MIQRNFINNKESAHQNLHLQGKDYAVQFRNISNHRSIQPHASTASHQYETRSSKCAQANVSSEQVSPQSYIRVSTDSHVIGVLPEELPTPAKLKQNHGAAGLDLSQAAKSKVMNNRAGPFASDAWNARSLPSKSRTLKEQLDQSQAYHLERNKHKVQDLLKRHYPHGTDQAA